MTVAFGVSGKAMLAIQGSELYWDPAKYDGGSTGAHDAHQALRGARVRRNGRGMLHTVTTTRAGAEVLLEYCRTVGSTFVTHDEPDSRADGRALLRVARDIERILGEGHDGNGG